MTTTSSQAIPIEERTARALESIAESLRLLRETRSAGTATAARAPQQGASQSAPAGDAPTNFPNYGRSKGAPIAGATTQDLEYYANGARRSLADPAKAQWHAKERQLLAVIEAEIARQGGASAGAHEPATGSHDAGGYDAGGPGEDDIPF